MPKTETERRQAIETRRKSSDEKAKLWIHDEWRLHSVWKVPVDALVLNVDNRRFAAERLWAEEHLGRSLDPENHPEDERSVESLLLDRSHGVQDGVIVGSPSKDYTSLKNDWGHRGQESPFWIRPDGTVRNGNRRLAMIRRIQREEGDSGFTRVEAVVLDPKDIDEVALLEMEQREQLTENFKVRYNDIDYLLALREAAVAREVDWFDSGSLDDVGGQLQTTVEKSKSEVVRDLYAIKYMDLFLEESGAAGQYHRLLRRLEVFRDIGRMMVVVEADYPNDFDRVLQVLFAAVRARKPYGDIRQLRQMFKKARPRFDRLADGVQEAEQEIGPDNLPTLAVPMQTSPDESDDAEDDDEESGEPSVTEYAATVGGLIDVAIDGYRASRQADVLRTLREIVNRLELLEEERVAAAVADEAEGGEARAALGEIVEWADRHGALLSEDD